MHKIYHKILTGAFTLSLLLGSWRGRVALFLRGQEAPLGSYPVRLELLPAADQERLRDGIPVHDTEELQRLLEDLLS